MMIKQTFSRIYKRLFWFHKRNLQTTMHYGGYSSDHLSHILHLFGYTRRYIYDLASLVPNSLQHAQKKKRLVTTPYRQSQIYLSQETKTCPKSPKLRAIALFANSGSKGTRIMNRRLKTRTFSKSKQNKSATSCNLL